MTKPYIIHYSRWGVARYLILCGNKNGHITPSNNNSDVTCKSCIKIAVSRGWFGKDSKQYLESLIQKHKPDVIAILGDIKDDFSMTDSGEALSKEIGYKNSEEENKNN